MVLVRKMLLTSTEAAAVLGLNVVTLYRWERRGLVKPDRVGRDRRWSSSDMAAVARATGREEHLREALV